MLGVVSLVTWALILIVTVKYVVFLMRADNKGEGGTLALMALAQRIVPPALRLGASAWAWSARRCSTATASSRPAMSVLSAVEGVRDAPGAPHEVAKLRAADLGRHPGRACSWCRPRARPAWPGSSARSCAVWFLVLAGLGVYHIADDLVDLPGAVAPLRGRSS